MPIDADLRSALNRYFESLRDSDHKLHRELSNIATKLSKAAKESPLHDSVHKQLLKQISQLSARITNTDNLLKQLEVENTTTSPALVEPPAYTSVSLLPANQSTQQFTHDLTPFEQALVNVYNFEPENWRRSYRPSSFGAANVDEIWRTGGDPKFTKKEGGIYHLVEAENRGYVVPEPGLRLQENYFRSEGISHLFDCPSFRPGASWARIHLVSPAIVQENGDRWTVSVKGELQEHS